MQFAINGNIKYAIISRNDLISNALLTGGFEVHLQQISNKILKDAKDGIVLDIGANMGSYTIPVATAHPHLQVYSFEPQRVVFYQLCTNILLNRVDNVYAHNYGLSDSKWTRLLEVPDYNNEHNVGAFSVDPEVRKKEYLVVTHGNTEQIDAICLDEMKLKNVKLIKLDVEGHELEVLQGANETIKASNYPPILFESWDKKQVEKQAILFKYLNDIGYTITKIDAIDNYMATKNKEK